MIKQSVKKIEEMLKKVTISTQYVEEEVFIDIKYVQKEFDNSMIIDSGAPVSLMSSAWLANYVEEAKVDSEEMTKSSSNRRFRLGKTPYISTEKVTANVINSNEVNFLCGEETLVDWRTVLNFEDRKLGFKEKDKRVDLIKRSHLVVKLELVGKWNNDEAVFVVGEEKDIKSIDAVRRIHNKLNHKSKEQMLYAFQNAGKLDKTTRENIEKVLNDCDICKKNSRSKSKPSVVIPRATDFNSIVSIDLKSIGKKYILWMICTFTKFIKGVVVNDKNPETIIKALHNAWCMDIGFPTTGWWCDNGGEFRNAKMEEFVNKSGLTINFTPSYSPWSNGINERNHYSCDVIVKKIMEEDKKVTLQEAVSMASWTHNTNQNTPWCSPLQLVTGKSIVLPGLSNGNLATESLYDNEAIRRIMERHHEVLKEYRRIEFTKKLEKGKRKKEKGKRKKEKGK